MDGLKPSQYLIDTARRNIEGDITIDEVQELLHSYYASAENRANAETHDEEADKAAVNIKKYPNKYEVPGMANNQGRLPGGQYLVLRTHLHNLPKASREP